MSGTSDEAQTAAALYVNQITASSVPQLSFNTVTTTMTATEISAVLGFGQRPLVLLIMSPTMAKTFGQALLDHVSRYEQVTGHPVQTVNEINAKLNAEARHV